MARGNSAVERSGQSAAQRVHHSLNSSRNLLLERLARAAVRVARARGGRKVQSRFNQGSVGCVGIICRSPTAHEYSQPQSVTVTARASLWFNVFHCAGLIHCTLFTVVQCVSLRCSHSLHAFHCGSLRIVSFAALSLIDSLCFHCAARFHCALSCFHCAFSPSPYSLLHCATAGCI